MYNLKQHGDDLEKEACDLFLGTKFPSYEIFWEKFVVPLTNRPNNVHLKSDAELQKQYPNESLEEIHERIIILQLHYSAFRMIFKAFKTINLTAKDIYSLENFFSSIYSALDISAELFGRYNSLKNNIKITIDPFDPTTSVKNSYKIRKKWNKNNPYPTKIKEIRDYRDLMSHGQIFAIIATPQAGLIALPKPGMIDKYLDWRSISKNVAINNLDDFLYAKDIANAAFDVALSFLENEWSKQLIII